VVAVERRGAGKKVSEFLRGVGAAFGVAEQRGRVDGPLWRGDLADGVGLDAPVVLGRLQDAVQQRSAGHDGVVADRGAKLVLPLAHDADADRAKMPIPKGRQQVPPEARLGGLERSRAVVGVDGPTLPPIARPCLERLLTESRVDPGSAREPGEQVVLEVAGGVAGGEGLAALAAVVQPPPDLIAAGRGLADARGRHPSTP
jgi:hypothetical protein